MGIVLRLYVSARPVGRAAVSLTAYCSFILVLGVMLCVTPAQALISTTGYARIVSPSAMQALTVAKRSLAVQSLGTAISGAGAGASVALRLVATGAGWPALGIGAGLVIGQYLLNAQQVAQITSASALPGTPITIPGWPGPDANTRLYPCASGPLPSICGTALDQTLEWRKVPPISGGCTSAGVAHPGLGWTNWSNHPAGDGSCLAFHFANSPATKAVPASDPQPATESSITDYLTQLPASDPNSMESNFDQVGAGVAPSPASTVTQVPVESSDVHTQVVPASSVTPTDTVVDPSAEPGPGPITTTESQSTTTTTTTTTHPDGSTTTEEATTAVSSCAGGEHDPRTLGTILQTHLDTWKGSGLAGTLSTLQLLTWPSASPTYTLQSSLLGSFSFDFTAWNGVLIALRTLIIAGASFAAYRIIFVGGSGGSD